jgi:transcriptional regulator with XRE-family HTH domain
MGPRQHKYDGAWCGLVRYAMKRAGLSQRSLAAALGEPVPSVNAWVSGKTRPPLEDLETWADALRLSGEERAQFRWQALEGYCHEEVWERCRDLERQLADAAVRGSTIATELSELRAHCGDLRSKLADARGQIAELSAQIDKLRAG